MRVHFVHSRLFYQMKNQQHLLELKTVFNHTHSLCPYHFAVALCIHQIIYFEKKKTVEGKENSTEIAETTITFANGEILVCVLWHWCAIVFARIHFAFCEIQNQITSYCSCADDKRWWRCYCGCCYRCCCETLLNPILAIGVLGPEIEWVSYLKTPTLKMNRRFFKAILAAQRTLFLLSHRPIQHHGNHHAIRTADTNKKKKRCLFFFLKTFKSKKKLYAI